MTVSLWTSILIAAIAGLFAAVVAPVITSRLARRSWVRQRRFELGYEAFRGAVGALASWSADALDPRLQASRAEIKGLSHEVEIRPETAQALEHYRGLLSAFFSARVVEYYDGACRATISMSTIPNTDFEHKRLAFVQAAVQELGFKT